MPHHPQAPASGSPGFGLRTCATTPRCGWRLCCFFWGGRGVPCKISEHSTWGKPLLYRHWVSCEISVFSFGCLRIMNEGPPRNLLKSDQNSSFRECFCEPLNKVESVLIPWWGGWWMGRLELGWGCWSAGCSCWLEIPHKLFLTKIPLSWNLLKCQNYLIFPGWRWNFGLLLLFLFFSWQSD